VAVLRDRQPSLLEIDHLSLRFGGIHAIRDVSLTVKQGEIYSIIGPNGAGKTSLFNCINGIYTPNDGGIRFRGVDLQHKKIHQISRMGISRAFQNIELFRGMTVLDNLMAAREHLLDYGLFHAVFYLGRCLKQEVVSREQIEDLIELLDLQHVRKTPVGSLAYGMQKRVELGRALAMEPELLLVDEPVSGMNLEETEDMARYLLDIIEEKGITVVLIEHDMGLVMDLSDYVTVLNFGEKIAEGPPNEIARNPAVIKAYLGETKTVVR
jgi:branched-chain amino acid transport system ATP-binding protein